MSNLFIPIPAPVGNGAGAPVDVSLFGSLKTFTIAGPSTSNRVTIEMSNQLVPTHWAPVVSFNQPDDKTLEVAARWLRAVVSNLRSGAAAPVMNLGGNDSGTEFVELVATAGNGNGAGVDTSALPALKTVQVCGAFAGSVQIEISTDNGTSWNTILSFQNPGQQSAIFTANKMRVSRNGVPASGSGLPIVNVAATSPGVGVGVAPSAQIRIVATIDNVGGITYAGTPIALYGGMTYGGLDESLLPNYLKVILTLPTAVAEPLKFPLPGIHLPAVPPGPVGETVFLYVPPIPLQPDAPSTDASMLVPIFGKGVNNSTETIDVTYLARIATFGPTT